MNLLVPAALWFSAVGLAVIALYLLKIRRHRAVVPSLEFWSALAGPIPARSLFQRLKRWLSLLLWLTITAALVLALGNPVLALGRFKPQSIVVILDNSASMQSIEDAASGKTRLRQALEKLDDLLDRRPVDDQWLLIEAARAPHVLASWTRDRRAIHEAAARMSPHLGSGGLTAARDLAADLLGGMPEPLIVVLSDGAAGEVARLPAQSPPLLHFPIGKTDDNLGISLLRVRTDRRQTAHAAHLRVVNGSRDAVKSQLVLAIDGSTVAVEPFDIAAGGTWEKTMVFSRPAGGVLRSVIDRPDALAIDDEAIAILPPLRSARVRLVSGPREAFFFEQALLAMDPLVDAGTSHTLTLEQYDRAAGSLEPVDLTIFNDASPAQLPPAGAYIFVNQWPVALPARGVGRIENPTLSVAAREHPLMQYLSIGAVGLKAAQEVTFTDQATTLADSADGAPLIFLIRQPDRIALCLAFDVLESDLPFRNAFPILLRNAVLYLVSEQSAWIRDHYAIGEPIEPLRPLPADARQVAVTRAATGPGPALAPETLDAGEGTFRFTDTNRVAGLRFDIGRDAAFTAVNLTSETESRIAPTPGTSDAILTAQLPLSGRLLSTAPWLALAVLAMTLVLLEWLTHQQRWTE